MKSVTPLVPASRVLPRLASSKENEAMAWGPKNLQTVLLPAERSFPSTDTNTITDVEVSSCGRFLAFSQTAGACVIYELRSGEPIFVEVEDRSLDAISLWSKDDQHKLLVGGTSCTLYVWDLIRHREIKRFPDMPARIYGVSWGPSGMFAACCGTEFVRIQKMTLDETLFEKKYDKESIYAVALNPIDPGQVIYGGTEGWCYVIQWKEGESVVERAKEETAIEQMQGRVNNCPCFPHKAKQDAERKVYHGSVITATEYDPTGTLFMTGRPTSLPDVHSSHRKPLTAPAFDLVQVGARPSRCGPWKTSHCIAFFPPTISCWICHTVILKPGNARKSTSTACRQPNFPPRATSWSSRAGFM